MTAPLGARLPRRTASVLPRESGTTGLSSPRMTSSFQHSAPAMFSPSVLPFTVMASAIEMPLKLAEQSRNAAGEVEILHQVFARGEEIGADRHLACHVGHVVERQIDAGPTGHGDRDGRRRWSSRRAPYRRRGRCGSF